MTECASCGAEIHFQDKFCSTCGAFANVGSPFAEQLGKAVGHAGRELGKLAEQVSAYVRDEANRKEVIISGAAAFLLLVGLTDNPISTGVGRLLKSDSATPQFTENGLPDFANYEDNFLGEDIGFIVTGTANVRNFPTSEGTQIIRTLQEGETIIAREVQAFDPESAWFKLSDGGYIWGGNIDRFDEVPTQGGPMFPANLRGEWSSMDTCFGKDMDLIVSIEEREISFFESSGHLNAITQNRHGVPQYHLTLSGEGEVWAAVYALNTTPDNLSISVVHVDSEDPPLTLFDPRQGCDALLEMGD